MGDKSRGRQWMASRHVTIIQAVCPQIVNWYAEKMANQKFDHETYGLKPKHRPIRKSERCLVLPSVPIKS
jgi:hypothetical protein